MKRVEDYAIGEYSAGLETLGRMTPEQQAAFYAKVRKDEVLGPIFNAAIAPEASRLVASLEMPVKPESAIAKPMQ